MIQIGNLNELEPELTDLIDGCKLGNPTSQKRIFEKYAPLVFTTCRRYNSVHYPAKDLMQDTFIKVFDRIHQFNIEKGKFESWIVRIAINLAVNAIRDHKMKTVKLDFDFTESNEEVSGLTNLPEEHIIELINQLPIGYKTVFNLYVIDGFSHKEIASNLNISESTSKSQLSKAKKTLRAQIIDLKKNKYGEL